MIHVLYSVNLPRVALFSMFYKYFLHTSGFLFYLYAKSGYQRAFIKENYFSGINRS